MREFCEKVLEFIKSEYSDSYDFKIDLYKEFGTQDRIELSIKINSTYTVKVTSDYMYHLFILYKAGTFIEERSQYVWQKELIDIIEGS
jgi:hypothetical protein